MNTVKNTSASTDVTDVTMGMNDRTQPLTPVSGHSMERATIQTVLENGFRSLHFPDPLEKPFVAFYRQKAVNAFRQHAGYVLLLYAVSGTLMLLLFSKEQLGSWPWCFLAAGIFLGLASVLALIDRLNDWHPCYTGACTFAGLTAVTLAPAMMQDPAASRAAEAAVILGYIAIYTLAKLPFRVALVACWGSGLAALLLLWLAGIPIDWVAFGTYFVSANILGTLLSYFAEHNERFVYLQERLLQLERDRLEEMALQLQKISREDALTHLANRRYFDEVMSREWSRSQRDGSALSVMFVDVDFFKAFNDTYGHAQGDLCLRQIAKVLRQQARRPGDLACRYGGEEFVVLYPQTNNEAIQFIAERTVKEVAALNIAHAGSPVGRVTVSAGVATLVPDSTSSPQTLLQQADQALYAAKHAGRNQWRVAS